MQVQWFRGCSGRILCTQAESFFMLSFLCMEAVFRDAAPFSIASFPSSIWSFWGEMIKLNSFFNLYCFVKTHLRFTRYITVVHRGNGRPWSSEYHPLPDQGPGRRCFFILFFSSFRQRSRRCLFFMSSQRMSSFSVCLINSLPMMQINWPVVQVG